MISVRLSSNFESFKPFYVVPFAFLLFVVGHFCRTRLKCSDGLPRQNNIQDGRNKTHNIIFRMFEKILDSKNTSTLMHDHLSCQNCRVQSHCVCMRRHLIFLKKKLSYTYCIFYCILFYFCTTSTTEVVSAEFCCSLCDGNREILLYSILPFMLMVVQWYK